MSVPFEIFRIARIDIDTMALLLRPHLCMDS